MYRGRLKRDLENWADRGFLDQAQAARLLADYDSRGGNFSLGGVLGLLAAVLLAAALLMLVAANWELIPRPARVIGIFVLIWACNVAGWLAHKRGATLVSAGALILAAASFGGGIAMIGQMYHLSGDAFSALFLWMAVTMGSAWLFGSGPLSGFAGLLAIAAFWTGLEDLGWSPEQQGLWAFWSPVAALAIGWLATATGAGRAKHFAWFLGFQWIWWYWLIDGDPGVGAGVAIASAGVFLAVAMPSRAQAVFQSQLGPSATFYPLLVALSALGSLHVTASGPLATAIVAVAILSLCIAAIALEGRGNGAVRYLAYAAFAAEILYLSYETIDSMLGTAAFFLLAGFIVAVIAFVVVRLERRFSSVPGQVSA
ncbi:DUF2157 domain-containing protein [Peteryoungia ipomoeae]|uniref:DUF2157 domain-containing protein n=1 Tax=Peteryoungia ipomoeae TaxID=1210932 RepID=A0A4S8P584_9HYPH|nr:DUF2157 domain-containing protein [Peteryoungia ipomoeae]THV25327.1 DUF2157 domain-containing protein [Peteryoungia ipomoeae]